MFLPGMFPAAASISAASLLGIKAGPFYAFGSEADAVFTLTDVEAGDTILAFAGLTHGSSARTVSMSGFNEVFSTVGSGNLRRGAAFERVATGVETSATIAPSSATGTGTWGVAYVIQGGSTVFGGSATGASGNANPPDLAPAAGSERYLWFAVAILLTTDITVSPANYSTLDHDTGSIIGVGWRDLVAASEDPGEFTNASAAWVAGTVAVLAG